MKCKTQNSHTFPYIQKWDRFAASSFLFSIFRKHRRIIPVCMALSNENYITKWNNSGVKCKEEREKSVIRKRYNFGHLSDVVAGSFFIRASHLTFEHHFVSITIVMNWKARHTEPKDSEKLVERPPVSAMKRDSETNNYIFIFAVLIWKLILWTVRAHAHDFSRCHRWKCAAVV